MGARTSDGIWQVNLFSGWTGTPSAILWTTLLALACFGITLLHFMLEPVRWNWCYLSTGTNRQLRGRIRDALFCTALATYILPFKLGIPLRLVLLRKSGDIAISIIGMVMAVDAFLSLAAWTLMSFGSAWIGAVHWKPPGCLWPIGLAAAAIFVGLTYMRGSNRTGLFKRAREALLAFDRPWVRSLRSMGILFLDVASYGVRHAGLVLLVTGDVSALLAAGAAGILATFAGILSGLPMGLIGYDATLVALLAVAGIQPEQALLVALVNRGLNLCSAALLGIPAAMRLGLGTNFGSIVRRIREVGNDGS